ncbi:MAG TPA: c-type cytochrome [Planctomycetaceae bacterium]|nr:c-type cytochrome [Planctomycetaceae bacterium]
MNVARCTVGPLLVLSFSISALMLPLGNATAQAQNDEFPKAFNTDPPDSNPPAPEEMVKLIELPPGFNVTLFAGEPDVRQPICMDFDDRGRLWVAECYTYSGGPYETKLRDRVIILEDTDGDGKHDKRTVFWDKGFMLTSLTWGFGGLWILHDGTLSFIPDKNGDDVPDSEPVVMLDGWSKDCGHNFVSGLIWGPDGWLWGRHGIVDTSYPGIPGTPKEERVFMNCGIWRYHPTKHLIEVVCNGTTNPWGLDYNEDGQFFMTNNVQGHLWHVIPGAHYQRMYGQDFNPYAFELMDMTADHYHWDTKTKWSESRDGVANDLGGGHSHVGALIYQGDNFPAEYRGKIFMCNTHGRRINVNRLDREGSGYVGRREPDFMIVKSPWFRGIDIKMGPEGAMYVSDWSDNGECHDHDGVHRTSGRIYRIAYGTPKLADKQAAFLKSKESLFVVTSPSNSKLTVVRDSWISSGDWFGRHTRRIRQEMLTLKDRAVRILGDSAKVSENPVRELLFAESIGGNDAAQLVKALQSNDALVVAQAIQLVAGTPERITAHFRAVKDLAGKPQPANVLLSLVSILQKLESADRWSLAASVLGCPENAATIAGENQLTLMTWYGIEPVVFNDGALALLDSNPKLQQFAVRRLAYEISAKPEVVESVLKFIATTSASGKPNTEAVAASLLTSFKAGLAGRAKVDAPNDWAAIEKQLRASSNKDLNLAVDSLAVMFGDGAAIADLRKMAADANVDAVAREQAIAALAQSRDDESVLMLFNLLNDRAVVDAAITALKSFDHPNTAKELLNRMGGFKDGNRGLAIDTMASRESYALDLIKAIEEGRFDARELTAAQVRQMTAFGNEHIKTVLEAKWGVIQETPEARIAAIEKWKHELTPETIAKADRDNGAALFKKSCAACHKLYGEGKAIAPDLTGANRSNLDYLLMNIIDPSSVVPKQFTTSVIALKDGRVITGVVVSETEQSLVIQTDKEQLTVDRDDVEESKNTGKSLMPDGMLDTLTVEQVRDLFGFVMPRK